MTTTTTTTMMMFRAVMPAAHANVSTPVGGSGRGERRVKASMALFQNVHANVRASSARVRAREVHRRSGATRARFDDDDDDDGVYSDRDRASGRRAQKERIKAAVNRNDDGESMRDAFLDGAEVFALTAAVGVKARAAYVERRNVAVATRTGTPVPPRAAISTFGDFPLYVAVVAGTLLRRIGKSRDAASVGALRGVPSSVAARIAMLEQANDSVVEVSRRTARDVSRVGTRLRLTRRELSPPLRKVQAETKENAQILAAVAQRIELLEAELVDGQSTMSGLHTVSSKQFEVLSKAISDLKQSQAELEARLIEVKIDAGAVKFEDQLVRDEETISSRNTDDAATTIKKVKKVDFSTSPNAVRTKDDDGDDDDDDSRRDDGFIRYPRRSE
jgi:hypothetical protein|mmetsp:Transcript_5720/g.19276  ORF Transcript_5720/g.19276 Transcript_5720/m.19276 type:complete len:389 (+) Transcript_5720:140-1306(+)